jgi:hypothetical protein
MELSSGWGAILMALEIIWTYPLSLDEAPSSVITIRLALRANLSCFAAAPHDCFFTEHHHPVASAEPDFFGFVRVLLVDCSLVSI